MAGERFADTILLEGTHAIIDRRRSKLVDRPPLPNELPHCGSAAQHLEKADVTSITRSAASLASARAVEHQLIANVLRPLRSNLQRTKLRAVAILLDESIVF